jgi:hypothetical protein
MNHAEHAETLTPLIDRLRHMIAVPVAGVGVIAPSIENHVEIAQSIMSAPLANYASIASAIYLTLMIIKTVRELYQSFKNRRKTKQ